MVHDTGNRRLPARPSERKDTSSSTPSRPFISRGDTPTPTPSSSREGRRSDTDPTFRRSPPESSSRYSLTPDPGRPPRLPRTPDPLGVSTSPRGGLFSLGGGGVGRRLSGPGRDLDLTYPSHPTPTPRPLHHIGHGTGLSRRPVGRSRPFRNPHTLPGPQGPRVS